MRLIRGIERRVIFRDDEDRESFLDRLGGILLECATPCYSWSLLNNQDAKGSNDYIVPKIKNLLAVRPQTPGHAVLMEGSDPQKVKEALKEIGFSEVSITPASDCMLTCDARKPKSGRNLHNVFEVLEQETNSWLEGIKSRDIPALKQLKNSSELYHGLLSFSHNSKRYFPCGAGLGLTGISCSEDVYLCHRFVGMDAYKLGNIFDKHLDRDAYQKSPIAFVQGCSDCLARHYCAGSCRYDNVRGQKSFCYWCVRELGESMTGIAKLLGLHNRSLVMPLNGENDWLKKQI